MSQKIKGTRSKRSLYLLWPEIIEHIISGLRSGLSLAETIIALGYRGPLSARPIFLETERIFRGGGDFEEVFQYLRASFHDGLADQVCEVLEFARGTGSREITTTLRTLGDHIRSDIAVRGEISAKHGWIKNSGYIAAAAPWILLLILSAQPNTVRAYSTSGGVTVLLFGMGMSVIAYLWMQRVGRLPVVPRIFR